MKKQRTNREFIMILCGALFLTVCFFSSSYALNNAVSPTAEFNYFSTDNLELSYVDHGMGNGSVLSLTDESPIPDSKGLTKTGYRFSVTNISSGSYQYRIRLVEDASMVEEDGCLNRQLYSDYIHFQFDNLPPKSLKEVESNGYVLYESSEKILPGNSEIHELRIWLGENTPKDIEEHYHGKIVLEEVENDYQNYFEGQEIQIGDMMYLVLENSDSSNAYVKLLLNSSFSTLKVKCMEKENCLLGSRKELSFIMDSYRSDLVEDLGQFFDLNIVRFRLLDMNEYKEYIAKIPSLREEPLLLYSLTDGRPKITNMNLEGGLDSISSRIQPVVFIHKHLLEKEEEEIKNQ